MPKYTRKTDGPSRFTQSKLQKVYEAMMVDKTSLQQISRNHSISISSLKLYRKKWREAPPNKSFKTLHNLRVLTDEEEIAFIQVLKEFKHQNISVTRSDALRLCYGFAEKVGSEKIEKWKNKKTASADWFYGFLMRHKQVKNLIKSNYQGYRDPGPSSTAAKKKATRSSPENGGSSQSNVSSDSDSSDADSNRKRFLGSRDSFVFRSSTGQMDTSYDLRGKASSKSRSAPSTSKPKKQPTTPLPKTHDIEAPASSDASGAEQMDEPLTSTGKTYKPSDEQDNELQAFEEELDNFVNELKSHGIHPSIADVDLIRKNCLPLLTTRGRKVPKKASQKKLLVPSVKKPDVSQSSRNVFANLYEQNLLNNVKEGFRVEYDDDLGENVVRAIRNFDENEFILEIAGKILNFRDGEKKSLQWDYISGKKRGKIFNLGKMEAREWIDCSSDKFAQAVQDSSLPNLLLKFRKVAVGSEMTKRLFFVARRPIITGETFAFDYCNVNSRNSQDYPFIEK